MNDMEPKTTKGLPPPRRLKLLCFPLHRRIGTVRKLAALINGCDRATAEQRLRTPLKQQFDMLVRGRMRPENAKIEIEHFKVVIFAEAGVPYRCGCCCCCHGDDDGAA